MNLKVILSSIIFLLTILIPPTLYYFLSTQPELDIVIKTLYEENENSEVAQRIKADSLIDSLNLDHPINQKDVKKEKKK